VTGTTLATSDGPRLARQASNPRWVPPPQTSRTPGPARAYGSSAQAGILRSMQFRLGSADWARIRLSPDGERLLGSWREGETERSMLNGRALPAVEWRRGASPACQWDPDLSRRAAVQRDGAVAYVVVSDLVGERRLGPFEDAKLRSDCFSTVGFRLMFPFTRGGATWVWLDGEELGPYAGVEAPRWLGQTPAFVVRSEAGRQLWIEGNTLGPFGVVWSVELAEDGVLGVSFQQGDAHFLVHGDRRYGPFERRPNFALGVGGRLAIERTVEDQVQVELGDGQVVGRFSGLRSLERCFSPDGRRLGFAYDQDDLCGFFLDGERREGLGYTDGPWWSPDGVHVAWGAESESGLLVVDRHEEALARRIDWESGASFRFAPSGDFCFTLDADGEQVLRIGQREFGPFALGDSARRAIYEKVAFSADGAHFAFLYEEQSATYVRHDERVLGPFGGRTSFTLSPAGICTVATLDEASLVASLLSVPA
jgi:hypothetical protein